jgi:coenzyme PQQ synthesis protein D (PqqD)
VSGEVKLKADALEWREVEGEIVALDLEACAYIAVNRTGTALWPKLVEGTSRDQLVQALAESFGIDDQTASRDVDAFVGDLGQRGLLDAPAVPAE